MDLGRGDWDDSRGKATTILVIGHSIPTSLRIGG